MKKYLLFIFLIFSFLLNAQVQRTFYGVTFGTSIEHAKTFLSKQGISFIQGDNSFGINNDLIITIPHINIGGHSVDKAVMLFTKKGFYKITFIRNFDYPYLSKGDNFYFSIHNDLCKKYSILDKNEIEYENSITKTIVILGLKNDKKTRIKLEFTRIPALKSGNFTLSYYENINNEKKVLGGSNNEL